MTLSLAVEEPRRLTNDVAGYSTGFFDFVTLRSE